MADNIKIIMADAVVWVSAKWVTPERMRGQIQRLGDGIGVCVNGGFANV